MNPEDLLAEARRLVARPNAARAGVWPRTAALLARQALELALDELWAVRPQTAGVAASNMRSQMLCLTVYPGEDVAARAAYLFAALSRACHYHCYELAPTAAELDRWLTETADLVRLLHRADARGL